LMSLLRGCDAIAAWSGKQTLGWRSPSNDRPLGPHINCTHHRCD
jgi:hypothetical protein